MQRIIIAALILAVGVAAFLIISSNPSEIDPKLRPDADGNKTGTNGGPPLEGATAGPPPTMEEYQLDRPGRLLMIAKNRQTWTATMELTFEAIKKLRYRTWYLRDTSGEVAGGVAGSGRGLVELVYKPTAEFLEEQNIQALLIDEVDPNALPLSFWNVAAERIRAGKMGLYFRPGFPIDDSNQAQTAHPAISHPVMKELLPVLRASSIEGHPTPGVFGKKQALDVTAEGLEHPATRLIGDVSLARDAWTAAGEGKGSFGSQFCYPVQELRPGWKVLVELAAATAIPAVVVSKGPERILWMGNNDFGDRFTHYEADKRKAQYILLNNMWIWLLGRAK